MSKEPAEPAQRAARALSAAAPYFPAALIALVFVATIALTWTGIGPGDVAEYVKIALAWRDHGPMLGETHWALRLPYVLPMASIFTIFGANEFTATLTNILYAGGLVAVTFIFARRYLGARAGLIASALVATSAFLVLFQIDVRVFGAELFFTVLASWLFIGALVDNAGPARFAIAGFLAGVAWLCREVAVFLPMSFGLILLMRRPLPFRAIVAMSAGFGAVILAELVFYGVVAGDPFYRYLIDLGHKGPPAATMVAVAPQTFIQRVKRPFDFLLTYATVTPFVLLAGLVWLMRGFRASFREGPRRTTLVVFGVSAVATFFTSAYVLKLAPPYYYPQLVYAAFLALGAFAAFLVDKGQALLAAAFLAGVVALNAAAEDFRNYDEYAEVRWLTAQVVEGVHPVATDGLTAVRTRMFLTLSGLGEEEAADRVRFYPEEPQPACALVYVATPFGASPAITPLPGWVEIESARVRRPRWTYAILRALGAEGWGSQRLAGILAGAPPVALYATSEDCAQNYRQRELVSPGGIEPPTN
jgi:hypothetical protein